MKIIRTEVLNVNNICIPEITATYDLLSRRRDGTITPQAPVIISGNHLTMHGKKDIRFCLTSAVDYVRVIEVGYIYQYSDCRIIADLPELEAGEYFPAIRMPDADGNESLYILPVSWVVRSYPYDWMSEGVNKRMSERMNE